MGVYIRTDAGVELVEVHVGRYRLVLHGQGRLEHPSQAGAALEMSHDRLDGPHEQFAGGGAGRRAGGEEGVAYRPGLDGVSGLGARTMRLKELTPFGLDEGIEAGVVVRLPDELRLRRRARHGDARAPPVRVHGGAADDALDAVAVLHGPVEQFKHNGREALSAGVPVRVRVPHSRPRVRGQHV